MAKDAKGHGSEKLGDTLYRALKPPSMIPGYPASGAHTVALHQATAGKTLAQLSAAGTNPAIPPPKIGGGN